MVKILSKFSLILFGKFMLIKIIRELTPEEVEERILSFEGEFGSFEKFEERFFRKKLDARLVSVYFEWASLINSYKGYERVGGRRRNCK